MSSKQVINHLEKNGLPTTEKLIKIASKADEIDNSVFFVYAGDANDDEMLWVNNGMSLENMKGMIFNLLTDYISNLSEAQKILLDLECQMKGVEMPENIDAGIKSNVLNELFSEIREYLVMYDPDLRNSFAEYLEQERRSGNL